MDTDRKTSAVEAVNQKKREKHLITDIILLVNYFLSVVTLQRLLFLLSFITYGIGDSITAVYMMEKRGVMYETNPLVRFVYISSGGQGVVAMKVFYASIILFFAWLISRRKNTHWKVNGFLFALIIGSIMVMQANLKTANDTIPQSAASIMFTFLSMEALFVMMGYLIDKLKE